MLLAGTGIAGLPNSHFHVPSLAAWLKSYELDRNDLSSDRDAMSAVFEAARKRGTGDTGMFGLRLQRESFDFFIRQVGQLYSDEQTDVGRITAAFGPTKFLYLTRLNKLDQAISLVKATQTGLWHKAADGSDLERHAGARGDLQYDFRAISQALAEVTTLDHEWNLWFEREGVRPVRITYDDLSGAPTEELGRVLAALGLDSAAAQTVPLPTAKLADATSRSWARRFQAEEGSGPT